MLDLILKNGVVVDPKNNVHGYREVGVKDGRIVQVEDHITDKASQYFDLRDRIIIPGVIDLHVHIGGVKKADRYPGLRMLARAGVTMALDLGTEMDVLIHALKESGSGITMGGLHPLIPGVTVKDRNPNDTEIREALSLSRKKGALGFKIMGGHYPLTPEATYGAIATANEEQSYMAFHAGTTATKSDLTGMEELPELVENNGLHVAHINAYCRGLVKDSMTEVKESIAILKSLNERVLSESHLAAINGTSGACEEGEPVSHVTRRCLTMKEYSPCEEGLERAFLEGYVSVVIERDGDNVLITGEEGRDIWKEKETQIYISFPVTPASTSFLCATEKDESGDFSVDAITSDGGNFPRNIIIERGLSLCYLGALTLDEFVSKITEVPAKMLGLVSRGHLGEGAIADITILNLKKREASMSFVQGKPIMVEGVLIGQGGTLLVTPDGERYAEDMGVEHEVVNLEESVFYRGG